MTLIIHPFIYAFITHTHTHSQYLADVVPQGTFVAEQPDEQSRGLAGAGEQQRTEVWILQGEFGSEGGAQLERTVSERTQTHTQTHTVYVQRGR